MLIFLLLLLTMDNTNLFFGQQNQALERMTGQKASLGVEVVVLELWVVVEIDAAPQLVADSRNTHAA